MRGSGGRDMKTQRVLVVLTIVNLALLVFLLFKVRAVQRQAGILRGTGLEVVDDAGRVRASIAVLPANPSATMPNGRPQAETTILRLIDQNGRPSVKLAMSDQGAGLYL